MESFDTAEFEEVWLDEEPSARWRSATAHGPGTGAAASGSSLLEVDPGRRLPRHTDSAEETIVVVSGTALVSIAEEREQIVAGGLTVVPADVPHEVANPGEELLRFAAVYAGADVVTTYEQPVRPDGGITRRPVA
jgi:quercetin dioxygenase-like cupin family protein